MGLLAVSTLHHSQPETLGSAFFPHLADAGASDVQFSTANWAERFAGAGNNDEIPLAKTGVFRYTNHAFGNDIPCSMRGVVALTRATMGMSFSFFRVVPTWYDPSIT